MKLLKYILAILFPPSSVFLEAGISGTLLLNVVLTLIGWLPGIVHALWFLTKQVERIEVNP